jgi:hypothetical protein
MDRNHQPRKSEYKCMCFFQNSDKKIYIKIKIK